jgi:hypothetical protein
MAIARVLLCLYLTVPAAIRNRHSFHCQAASSRGKYTLLRATILLPYTQESAKLIYRDCAITHNLDSFD